MYCTNCGSEIPDDAKFCPFCAKQLDSSNISPVQPTTPFQTTSTPYQGSAYKPSKTSGSTAAIIIVVVVVFIVGIFLIYSGFQSITTGYFSPGGITMLIIGIIMVLCLSCTLCGKSGGGGGCGGCDGGGCDCGDCDCGGCDC